jgi:hypothetical protein
MTVTPPTKRRRGRRIARLILLVILGLLALATVGFLWYAQPVPLLPEATAALTSTEAVDVSVGTDGTILFTPTAAPPTVGLVLYPGGKVPPAAYAPAARAIAEAGYLVAIVDVPFNLAVFDINAASRVIGGHPEIEHWAVGGHSLGGSMAAQFIDGHPGVVDGLVLWASYSAADLSDQGIGVLSSYGTLDRGVPSFTSPENVARLGDRLTFDEIDGGNHEQMGWYTGQPNDPPATISRQAQQDRIVEATRRFLGELGSHGGG